jgi:hypothetical protein
MDWYGFILRTQDEFEFLSCRGCDEQYQFLGLRAEFSMPKMTERCSLAVMPCVVYTWPG